MWAAVFGCRSFCKLRNKVSSTSSPKHSRFHHQRKRINSNSTIMMCPATATGTVRMHSRWASYKFALVVRLWYQNAIYRFVVVSMPSSCATHFHARSECRINSIHSKMCRVFGCCTFHWVPVATEYFRVLNRYGNDRCTSYARMCGKLHEITLFKYSLFFRIPTSSSSSAKWLALVFGFASTFLI